MEINKLPSFTSKVLLLNDMDRYAQGGIYLIDIHAAKSLASAGELSFFKHAIINGDKFTGRGIECKEPMPVKHNYYETQYKSNSMNDLSKVQNWKKYSHSSFVRYKACKTTFSSDFGKDLHGHLNAFFRVNVPQDKFLHGTPMANLVPYKISLDGGVRKLMVSEPEADGFIGIEPFFVAVTNFYNSVQLVCPFDDNENPIIFDKRKIKLHLRPYISNITGQSVNGIHHVYLLDLYPHKIKIGFEKKNIISRRAKCSRCRLR